MKVPSRQPSQEETESDDRSGQVNQCNRKKRRRCGVCSPCLTKINCESCSNCLNRKTGHQICKYRKCVELRKKNAVAGTAEEQLNDVAGHEEEAKSSRNPSPMSEVSQPSSEVVPEASKVCETAKENPSTSPNIASSPEVTDSALTLKVNTSNETHCVPSPAVSRDTITEPHCSCKVKDESTAYTHLGVGSSVADVHSMLAKRFNMDMTSIRIEQVQRSVKEAKTPQGCPVARWVLRRSGTHEKVLSVVRERQGHTCNKAIAVLCIVVWDGISERQADYLYTELTGTLNEHATPTVRRCGTNDSKLCACQGTDSSTSGASFSFGCAWNMYFNGCKFARSKTPRKFKLQNSEKEDFIDHLLQDVATQISVKYKTISPDTFQNQTCHNDEGYECRLGTKNDAKPFSGITCCVDFCAHNHRDKHNMDDGATVVLTLLGQNARNTTDDDNEQLHSLPWYQLLDENQNVAPPNYVIPKHILKSPARPKPPADKTPSKNATNVQNGNQPNVNTGEIFSGNKNPGFQNAGYQTPVHQASEYTTSGYQMSGYQTPGYQTPGYQNLRKPFDIWNSIPPGYDQRASYVPNGVAMDTSPGFPFGVGQLPAGYELTNGEVYSPYLVNGFKNFGFTTHNGFHHNESSLHEQHDPTETRLAESAADTSQGDDVTDDVHEDVTWIDDDMGGVGLALSHGSILVECAKVEVHATTSLRSPNRKSPSRLSLVFYQHKHLNYRNHGSEEYKKKLEQKKLEAAQLADAEKNENASQFGIGYLEMLAETALKQHGTKEENDMAHHLAHDAPRTELNLQQSLATSTVNHGQFTDARFTNGTTHAPDNAAQPLTDTQAYPLSEYLRSLKHKEPPVVTRHPYINGYGPPPPMFNPLLPATEFNPFTHAGGSTYPVRNSHYLESARSTSELNGQNKPDGLSKNTNGYTVEALLGRKRDHEEPTRDNTHVKQRKFEQNGFPRYGPSEAMPAHFFGWPGLPDVPLNPNKFLRYDAFPPKAVFTGTTTHAIDTLVSMAPYARPFLAGNYQW